MKVSYHLKLALPSLLFTSSTFITLVKSVDITPTKHQSSIFSQFMQGGSVFQQWSFLFSNMQVSYGMIKIKRDPFLVSTASSNLLIHVVSSTGDGYCCVLKLVLLSNFVLCTVSTLLDCNYLRYQSSLLG